MKGLLAIIILAASLLQGCVSVEIPGMEYLNTAATVVTQTAKAARPITDAEEYYVGRSVAVRLLAAYPLWNNEPQTAYVNRVGQVVAMHSDKPFTYNGYHFAVLDTPEVNAFACPGGTIFITRGMLGALRSEDELAAVLAHEVAHINFRHGVDAIQKARWTEAATAIGAQAARDYGSSDLASLVTLFEGAIDDVFKTLVVNGYGRSQEYDADATALTYLERAGYAPAALEQFVQRLIAQGKTGGGGILQTHPATEDRLANIGDKMVAGTAAPAQVAKRTKRFAAVVN